MLGSDIFRKFNFKPKKTKPDLEKGFDEEESDDGTKEPKRTNNFNIHRAA